MTVKLSGMSELTNSFNKLIKTSEKRIVDARKKVAEALLRELIENVPVWSGKTVRGVSVSNSDSGSNAREPHPDRRDFSKDGVWENHKEEWGDTKNMPLGAEPERASSEALALASVESADYSLDRKVYVTANAYIWAEIDSATYRGADSRGTPVISKLAIEQIRSLFAGVVK